jgi:hypothetical protein
MDKGGKHTERTNRSGPYYDLPLDSREGIEALMQWARRGGWVLNEFHEDLARKHGVSADGVIISRPIPQK